METRQPTPEGHEDGEEDGGRVVEEVAGTSRATGCAEMPVVTGPITQWTHGEVLGLITHLQTGRTNTQNTSTTGSWSSPTAYQEDEIYITSTFKGPKSC